MMCLFILISYNNLQTKQYLNYKGISNYEFYQNNVINQNFRDKVAANNDYLVNEINKTLNLIDEITDK